jgi:hypothetical protein
MILPLLPLREEPCELGTGQVTSEKPIAWFFGGTPCRMIPGLDARRSSIPEILTTTSRLNASGYPWREADVFDASGAPVRTVGELLRTSTDAREIQFALKVIW